MIAQRLSRLASFTAGLIALLILGACASSPEPGAEARRHAPRMSQTPADEAGTRAAGVALQQVGVPYRYGGQNPGGFDCSGLVHYAYHRAGKSVPRTTGQLWSVANPVRRADMRVGDLVFFAIDGKMQHVGMYLGDGRFVHAPSTGKTVSVASLSSPFYEKAFLRAGRLH